MWVNVSVCVLRMLGVDRWMRLGVKVVMLWWIVVGSFSVRWNLLCIGRWIDGIGISVLVGLKVGVLVIGE